MTGPIRIGEAFVGAGADAAHVNTVLGPVDGPVGTAWATSLATPTVGHLRFVAVLRPNLPVRPPTLFVPKADIRGETHARMTWGPAQAGVAGGVLDAVADGTVPEGAVDDLVLLAAVWVDWDAADATAVYENNREATAAALRAAASGAPTLEQLLEQRHVPSNPFFEA